MSGSSLSRITQTHLTLDALPPLGVSLPIEWFISGSVTVVLYRPYSTDQQPCECCHHHVSGMHGLTYSRASTRARYSSKCSDVPPPDSTANAASPNAFKTQPIIDDAHSPKYPMMRRHSQREKKIRKLTLCCPSPTLAMATLLLLEPRLQITTTTRRQPSRVVVVNVHCGLSLSHLPSPSCPSPRHHRS